MVEQRNADNEPRLRDLRGQQAILFAGLDVSARMIVNDKDPGHRFPQERPEDISGADMDPIDLAERGDMATANAVPRVEAEDVYGLLLSLT